MENALEVLFGTLLFISVITNFYFFFGKEKALYKLRKLVINYRGKSGFSKKVHWVIVFFVIGVLISFLLYLNWYNSNYNKISTFKDVNISDFVIKDSSIVSNKKELIQQFENIKNGEIKEFSFFSMKSLYAFFEDRGDFVGWLMGFYTLFTIIIGFYEFSKFEKFSLLFQKSKDKIKILNKFSSSNLFNENSIFENIIDLLDRTLTEANVRPNTKVHLKMLLCSPLLDRSTNNPNNWGNEFVSKIQSIATTQNIDIRLSHLPNEMISGVNPLRNFTEVLANYSAKNHKLDELEAFGKIWSSTKQNIFILESLASQNPNTFSINDTKLDDIPFQIIISKTPLLEEVIVFFAGKSNLENESVSDEPRGFHSVDPVVVETFDKIFNDYVSLKQRVPIRPEHTQKIINEITSLNCESNINNYLNSNSDDIFKKYYDAINVKIAPKTFSPLIANSSKFTSRVIQETIRKEDVFLEIGAGCGVQTILAYKMLNKLGNTDPKVFAIENSETAFNCLEENCSENSVYPKDNNGNRKSGVYIFKDDFVNINSNKEIKNGLSNAKFTYIVADLPFVDTKVNDADKDLESAFFDEKHKLQESLLKFFAENNEMIDEKARLLTSFSSLGGDLDILSFEMLINKHNLSTIKKVAFVENGYEWITYVIMRRSSFVNFLPNKPDRYWWEELNVKS